MSVRDGDEQLSVPGDRGADDTALDALLATGRWPDLSFAAQSRLRDRLAAQRPSWKRYASRTLAWSAVAAGVAVVVPWTAFLAVSSKRAPADRSLTVSLPAPSRPTPTRILPAPEAPLPPPTIVSRPANQYERLVMATAMRREPSVRVIAAPPPDALNAWIDDAVNNLASGQIDLAAAAKQVSQSGVEPARAALLQRFAKADGEARIPLVQLYGQLATQRELATLLRLADQPPLRTAAMNSIAKLSASSQLPQLIERYPDEPSRVLVYREMIARNDPRLTEALVSAVLDPRTQRVAVAAMRGAPNPPVQAIVEQLDASRVSDRISAAKALGALCHRGGTMKLLQAMVDRDVHRREALIALLSCSDPTAWRYLDDVRRRRPEVGAELSALRTEVSAAL
jgi:hypothetical protein